VDNLMSGVVFGVLLVLHIIVAFFLIGVILIQGGRGGLGEALGGGAAQSLFGGGVNTVMTKVTAAGAAIFMVTCLLLARLSTERGRSVIDRQVPITLPDVTDAVPTLADTLMQDAQPQDVTPTSPEADGEAMPVPGEPSAPASEPSE